MDWRAALLSRLTGVAGGRVYWADRPQTSVLPALVLLMASDDRPQNLKGFDLNPGRVQVDAYGRTSKESWDLAEAAIVLLLPGGTFNDHVFFRADIAIGPRDLAERVGSTTIFRVSMDLIFHHAPSEEGS